MYRQKNGQTLIPVFFTALYLFVSFFAQNLHHHGSGMFFKEYHFQKAEKTFSAAVTLPDGSDCYSCHISHQGKYLLPREFSVIKVKSESFYTPQFFAELHPFSEIITGVNLRAPPFFLI